MSYSKMKKSELINELEKRDKKVRIIYTIYDDDYKNCENTTGVYEFADEEEALKKLKKLYCYKKDDDIIDEGLMVELNENDDNFKSLKELLEYIRNCPDNTGNFVNKRFDLDKLVMEIL